jgi:hypothetical protein
MRQWIYAISEDGEKKFILKDGTKKDRVSADNFKKHVLSGMLSEKDDWNLTINYLQVNIGDEVFIYHTAKKRQDREGIIGYARVNTVNQRNKTIHLTFDVSKCRSLIEQPIPAEYVNKQWHPHVHPNILSLDSFRKELNHLLHLRGWERKSLPIETEEILNELHLKPVNEVVVTFGNKPIVKILNHDNFLELVVNFLVNNQFEVHTQNFGKLRSDLVGVKDSLIVIVEGKTNELGQGREEARQAFGQLKEYLYLWCSRTSISKIRTYLWIAFQNKPLSSVISFLEHYDFIVSYIDNSKVKLTGESEKLFKSFYT